MTEEQAIKIGMAIAERHTAAVMDLYKVEPDAKPEEALRGAQVWLAAEIMKALGDADGKSMS